MREIVQGFLFYLIRLRLARGTFLKSFNGFKRPAILGKGSWNLTWGKLKEKDQKKADLPGI